MTEPDPQNPDSRRPDPRAPRAPESRPERATEADPHAAAEPAGSSTVSSSAGPTPASAPKLSPLAVVALVVALVPCCPFTGWCGTMLGLVALRRIRLSGGALRGRKLALWAAVLGIVSSFVWMYAWERFARDQQQKQEASIVSVVETFAQSASAGADDAAVAVWVPAHAPDTAALDAWRVAADRLGSFERVTVTKVLTGGSMLSPRVEASLTFRFERGSAIGAARFATGVVPGRLTPTYRLERLRLDDPPHDPVTLGAAAAVP